MDSPVVLKNLSRSSNRDARSNKTPPSENVRALSRSLDGWQERQKLEVAARGQLDASKGQQINSSQQGRLESARQTILRLTSRESSKEDISKAARRRPHELPIHENVPSNFDNDRKSTSSRTISGSQRGSSSSTSSSGVSPHPSSSSSPVSPPPSQLLHLYGEEKAEESRAKKKAESIRNQAVGSPQQAITAEIAGIVARTRAELASSPYFLRSATNSPVSNSPLSPVSPRSVSATYAHDGDGCRNSRGGGEDEVEKEEEEEEKCVSLSNGRKRASEILVESDAQADAHEEEDIFSFLDSRSNSKAIGSEGTINGERHSNARDAEEGDERPKHLQKNILTQSLEDDEMWDGDFTAIEATQTLNNENARQKLLLRRKSSLAHRQRPTRTRKRFSDSESESESSSLNVESVTYEKKKTRETYYRDLAEKDEYKCSTDTSSKTNLRESLKKVRNELPEVPHQNVLNERKDPGLQLKKEKDQENRAVLDTTPVVLRKNSYNSFENSAGSRKPFIQEISFDEKKFGSPERTTPFVTLRRTSRHHPDSSLRSSKDPQSSEALSDRVGLPHVGAAEHSNNHRRRSSDLFRETNSSASAEVQPRILRSVSRIDKRVFEDGPKTAVNPEEDWLKKRNSTIVLTQKDTGSRVDSDGGQNTERWTVIRQPLESETDNKDAQPVVEKPVWLRQTSEKRRTQSYCCTPPTKESDSNETPEAPWIKEFRNSRKRVSRIFNNRDAAKPASEKPSPVETPFVRVSKPLSSLAGDQSSRGVVSGKPPVNVSSSPAPAEEKEATPAILPEVTTTPKFKVERKSSFNNTNESGVSSRMKENRSPVSRNNINTADNYLPSWSVADAGEAPASLADTRGDIPEWQRKLLEKNKQRKQSIRRTKSEGSELYEHDYELDSTGIDAVSYLETETEITMYSQNNDPYATPGAYPQSSTSVPDVNSYQGHWYNPQAQSAYYGGYDPNYYYANSQHGSLDMAYSMQYMPPTEYQHYDTSNYNQNQYAPMTKAYSCDSINQFEKTATPKRSPKLGDLSISPKHQNLSNSRSASPKSPRFVRVLPTTLSNDPSPASSPRKSDVSGSPYSSPASSNPPSPRHSLTPDSPVRQKKKSSRKELPTFSLSNAESQSGGSRRNYSQKPMYVRVLPPPNLPNKLSPKKLKEYTDLSPDNSPSRIPVPISDASQKSFKNRLFGKKQESSTGSTASDDTEKKSKSKYKIKIPVSPKFSPFRKKQKSPKHNESDEENSQDQDDGSDYTESTPRKVPGANEPEKGPYYRILRSPLKMNAHSRSMPIRSYSMPHPVDDMVEHRAKLRPVPGGESNKTEESSSSPEKTKNVLRRGRRIEDSSSAKSVTDDGSPKAQPAWRQQLKNRTSNNEENSDKKSQEEPDWIKQAEERRARLAKTKLLGE